MRQSMIKNKTKIKKNIFTLLLITFFYSALPALGSSHNFSKIFIFGDSLSDNGSINKKAVEQSGYTGFTPVTPYFNGRFTNGKVWIEQLSERLNIPDNLVFNYAYGGAEILAPTDQNQDQNQDKNSPPNLSKQIETYLKHNPTADPAALYIIWLGNHDILRFLENLNKTALSEQTEEDCQKFIDQLIQTVKFKIQTLISHGAKYILSPQLFDLSVSPYSTMIDEYNNSHEYSSKLKLLITKYNQQHKNMLSQLTLVFPEILFINFDFDSLLPVSEENIVKYNMQNTTERCSRNDYLHNNQPICSNPDQYVFWDYLHPTAIVHSIMAERIFEVLN